MNKVVHIPVMTVWVAVTIDLAKPQRKRSTLSVTFGDKQGKQTSKQGKYTGIHCEPGEAWYPLFPIVYRVLL